MLGKLLPLLIVMGLSLGAQPAFHSDVLIKQGAKQLDLGLLNAPIYGIASHIAADRLVGESAIDLQLDIAGVREVIMYVNTPDDQKTTFLVNSFWGLFPDLVDKLGNTHYFHPDWNQPVTSFNKGATDLLEELAVLSYTVKF
jgi:hypothetical protein